MIKRLKRMLLGKKEHRLEVRHDLLPAPEEEKAEEIPGISWPNTDQPDIGRQPNTTATYTTEHDELPEHQPVIRKSKHRAGITRARKHSNNLRTSRKRQRQARKRQRRSR
jgi:hypothetical protein